MRSFSLLLGLFLSTAALPGCAEYEFSDSVDLTLDFRLRPDRDQLHTPYVVGAQFDLYVHDARDREDFHGWRLESSDPELLRIEASEAEHEDDDHLHATAVALAEGDVDLLLVDDGGDVVSSVTAPIRFPSRIELHAAAPAFLDRADIPAETEQPRVLVDGLATFLVRYFDGDTLLHGNGALSVADEEIASADQSYLFEDRDWLRLSPTTEGLHTVELSVGGRAVQTVEVDAVPSDAIAWVELHGQDESGAKAGADLMVIAQAYDEAAEPIYGIDYAWNLEGEEEPGDGDLFRYTFDPHALSTLEADYRGASAQAEIRGVDGYVDSSNEIGCSIGGHRRPPGLALLLLALGLFSRRRNEHDGI